MSDLPIMPDHPSSTPPSPSPSGDRPRAAFATFDEATLRRFLSYIVDPSAGATELRILNAQYESADVITQNPKYSSTLSAWYDNANAIVNDARKLRQVSAYICLNPTTPDLLGRSYNRLTKVRNATTDDDIVCLRWFYIDVDPVRPADISATHEELAAAVAKRDIILNDHPEIRRVSLTGRSGNGAFIMARLPDYPNDHEHRSMIAAALDSIIARYSDARIKIDVKTKNPSRVGCVPGTLKCKGSHIPARPWKMATLEGVPESGEPDVDGVPGPPPTLDLRDWLARNPAPVAVAPVRPVTHQTQDGYRNQPPWATESDRSHRLKRASSYVDRMPEAISTHGGHDATFAVACALIKGFDLSTGEAAPIMDGYNGRCQPHWEAHELAHKLKSADEKPDDKPRGYLYDADRPGWNDGRDDGNGSPRREYAGPGADFIIGDVVRAIGGNAGNGAAAHVGNGHAAANGHAIPTHHIPEVAAGHATTNGHIPPPLLVAPIKARAAHHITASRIEDLYRDADFLRSFGQLERANPGEAVAIKAGISAIKGWKARDFKLAVDGVKVAHRRGLPPDGQPGEHDDEGYSPSDMGNAQRFLAAHGHEVRWCKPYGDWMVYDGMRWKQDSGLQADAWAQEIPGLIGASIRADMDEAEIKSITDWKLKSESKLSLANLLVVSRASVPVIPEEFDRDPWLFNVQNGTIDLKTGEFHEHRPTDLMTRVAPVNFDEAATCPRWDKFVSDIMANDELLTNYIRRILGYAMTGITKDHAFFVCYGGGGNGKALATDTPIAIPSGWTTMGELQVGDTVFDDQGKPCRVTFATPVMRDHDCFEVEFKDGSKIVADADHIWEVDSVVPGCARATKGKREVTLKTTEEIANSIHSGLRYATPGHPTNNLSYRHRIKLAKPIETPDADLPIHPYVFGTWLGDGNSGSAMICCHDSDYQVMEEIAACGVQVERKPYIRSAPMYQLGDKKSLGRYDKTSISARMRQLGVKNNKHIPAIYLRASIDQRQDLMCGLMDTDGTISKGGQCEFAVLNRQLAYDFHELACSLGYKPTMRVVPAKIGDKYYGNNYRVQFWAYEDRPVFRLKRKVNRLKVRPVIQTQGSFRQIVAARKVESVPVRCIQVDSPSRLYLAGKTMIPTHNTTLFSTVSNIIGDYAIDLDPDVILAQANAQHPTGLTDFEGRRLVVSEETDGNRGLAEALVKRLSGGDKIRARKMHGDFYTFKPTHHLFLATNHKPNIRNNDFGLWRRLKLIPFEVTFGDEEKDGKKPNKDIRKPDRDLMDKLAAEASGILNWLLAGCKDWQSVGLNEPKSILDATQEYRTEMDELGWFLEEKTDDVKDDPAARVVSRVIYGEYKAWANENNIKHPVGPKKFGAQLNDRGFTTWKVGGETYKRGLRLKINGASVASGPADVRAEGGREELAVAHIGEGREPGDDGDWLTG